MKTLLLVLILVLAGPAAGQEKYPSRPVDFIVTWGTGGGADAMARQIANLAQPTLGVALPVSNVPGASGNTGMAQLINAKPDGYTIATFIQDTLMTIPMGLARYTVDDFEWITRTQVADSFLFVKADSSFKTAPELFKHAQANPGKLQRVRHASGQCRGAGDGGGHACVARGQRLMAGVGSPHGLITHERGAGEASEGRGIAPYRPRRTG